MRGLYTPDIAKRTTKANALRTGLIPLLDAAIGTGDTIQQFDFPLTGIANGY